MLLLFAWLLLLLMGAEQPVGVGFGDFCAGLQLPTPAQERRSLSKLDALIEAQQVDPEAILALSAERDHAK